MIRFPLASILLLNFLFTNAQKQKLTGFKDLVNKVWKASGTWGDGSSFEQTVQFTYELDSTVVIAKSMGFVDAEQKK